MRSASGVKSDRRIDRRCFLAVLGAVALAVTPLEAADPSSDVFAGNWLLKRGKSDFNPPFDFFKRTMRIELAASGYTVVIQTISDRRQTYESVYSATLDNKDVPITESELDTMALRRVDAKTLESTGKIKGQKIETGTWKVSPDGKVLTIMSKGSIKGQDYDSTQVFVRQ